MLFTHPITVKIDYLKYLKSIPLLFLSLLLISFFFRLYLTPTVFHADLVSQASWGQDIFDQGAYDFYSRNKWIYAWPNHPPLTSLYYGYSYIVYRQISLRLHQSYLFLNHYHLITPSTLPTFTRFVGSFDQIASLSMPFPFGYLLTLKLFPILGDILIGILLYYFAARIKGVSHPIIYPIIYLLSPFSWYISSLWGQTDQLSFLLTFISFFLLPRSFVPAVILFYLGVSLKPTSLFLAPMFLYLTLRFRPKKISLLVGLLACLALTVFIFGQFTHKNFLDFFIHNLYPRLADRPNRLTTNAYNFWHIFTLDRSVDSQLPFILITGNILGYIFYIILNLFSFRYLKKISPSTLITSFFIISFGSWLFLTNMLDRYAFAGVASGLFLTLYHPKTLKYWLPLSIIFWLNLFRGWWFPTLLSPIKYLLTFSHFLIGLPLSIANVFAYFRLIPPPSSILHPKA